MREAQAGTVGRNNDQYHIKEAILISEENEYLLTQVLPNGHVQKPLKSRPTCAAASKKWQICRGNLRARKRKPEENKTEKNRAREKRQNLGWQKSWIVGRHNRHGNSSLENSSKMAACRTNVALVRQDVKRCRESSDAVLDRNQNVASLGILLPSMKIV